jgi:hypothetical protein
MSIEAEENRLYRKLLSTIHLIASADDMGNEEAWRAISNIVRLTRQFK